MRIIHIGENVIDLVCIVDKSSNIKFKDSHLEIDASLEFYVLNKTEKKAYHGKMVFGDNMTKKGNKAYMKCGKKYDQVYLEEIAIKDYTDAKGLKLIVRDETPGGSSSNTGKGMAVFTSSQKFSSRYNVRPAVVVPNKDDRIGKFLKNCEYIPQGWGDGIGLNINFTNDKGEKITLRTSYNPYQTIKPFNFGKVSDEDVFIINTTKNSPYLSQARFSIPQSSKVFIVSTDSLIKKLIEQAGRDYLVNLINSCNVLISNDSELDYLINMDHLAKKKIKSRELGLPENFNALKEAMLAARADSDKLVYTTLGKFGIALLYKNHIYMQGTVSELKVEDENGSGDGVVSVIVPSLEVGLDPVVAMIFGNIAGQIKICNKKPSGDFMATLERITEIQKQYKQAPLETYKI